jgi:hypothetical protein
MGGLVYQLWQNIQELDGPIFRTYNTAVLGSEICHYSCVPAQWEFLPGLSWQNTPKNYGLIVHTISTAALSSKLSHYFYVPACLTGIPSRMVKVKHSEAMWLDLPLWQNIQGQDGPIFCIYKLLSLVQRSATIPACLLNGNPFQVCHGKTLRSTMA